MNLSPIPMIRQLGYDAMVLPEQPGQGSPLEGLAFRSDSGIPFINIYGFAPAAETMFVLLHEAGHHVHGDTTHWTSRPEWIKEHAADQFALGIIRDFVDAGTFARLENLSRDHIRPLLQSMIDAEVYHHVSLKVADWAGCAVPPKMRRYLEMDD